MFNWKKKKLADNQNEIQVYLVKKVEKTLIIDGEIRVIRDGLYFFPIFEDKNEALALSGKGEYEIIPFKIYKTTVPQLPINITTSNIEQEEANA